MRYILIVLLIAISTISKAQPPGYLGKRFTVSYDQLVGPNYLNILGINKIEHKNMADYVNKTSELNANFNYTGSISIDYVFSKSKSAGLSIGKIYQTMYFDDSYFETYDSLYGYTNEKNIVNGAKLNGFSVSAFIKFFRGQSIAPLGDYIKLELLYSNYQIESFINNTNAELYKLSKGKLEPISNLGVAVTFGRSRIFWDRVVVSSGVTAGMRFNFITSNFVKTDGSESNKAVITLRKDAQFWHGQNLLYNFHLGIGLLIF